MIQRITGLLPEWGTRSKRTLGHQIHQSAPSSRRVRFLVSGSMMLLLALGVSGCAVAPDVPSSAAGQNLTERMIEILLYPMLVIQTALGVSALALTISATGKQHDPETEDNLGTTPDGTVSPLRARWVGVFHRLRPGLVFVTLVRLVIIGLILRDLVTFEGRAVDLFIGSSALSAPIAVLGWLMSVTAALMIPFTMVAFDAAAGAFLSVVLKKRLYGLIFQFVELVLRVAFVVGITWLTLGFIAGSHSLEPFPAWLTVFGLSAFADWGLMMMHPGFSGEVWGTIPYGILIGLALLLYAIIQIILSQLFLRWAVLLAEKPDLFA